MTTFLPGLIEQHRSQSTVFVFDQLQSAAADGVDIRPAYEIVAAATSPERIAERTAIDAPTKVHELTVGALALDFGRAYDLPESTCTLLAEAAGQHDDGKYHSDVLRQIRRTDDFGPEVRQWVREQHTARGRDSLRAAGQEQAAIVAQRHHSPIPSDYDTFSSGERVLWGITHVVQAFDVVAALGFDPSRIGYITDREGSMPNARRIIDITMNNLNQRDPVLHGRTLPLRPYLEHLLGVSSVSRI